MGPDSGGGEPGGVPVPRQVGDHRGIWAPLVAAPEKAPRGCRPARGPRGRAGDGVPVTKESAKARHAGKLVIDHLLPPPHPQERGRRLAQASSASPSRMEPFPVTCLQEDPGKRAARPGACRRWTETLRVVKRPGLFGSRTNPPAFRGLWRLLGAWLGDQRASAPSSLLVPGRVRGPSTS